MLKAKKILFIKMKIAIKEADETEYWLFLCDSIESYPESKHLLEELELIIKILNKIISSSIKSIKN